jgi:hypothetical protein
MNDFMKIRFGKAKDFELAGLQRAEGARKFSRSLMRAALHKNRENKQ